MANAVGNRHCDDGQYCNTPSDQGTLLGYERSYFAILYPYTYLWRAPTRRFVSSYTRLRGNLGGFTNDPTLILTHGVSPESINIKPLITIS